MSSIGYKYCALILTVRSVSNKISIGTLTLERNGRRTIAHHEADFWLFPGIGILHQKQMSLNQERKIVTNGSTARIPGVP